MGVIEERWEKMFQLATEYYNEFGNLKVRDKSLYKGEKLGTWIYWQRKTFRNSKLSEERTERLNSIGMIWSFDEVWNGFYEKARCFYDEFKTLLVPVNYQYQEVLLGKWISHQRQRYIKGTISDDEIKKLEEIDMIWDASKNNIATSFPEQAIFFYLSQIYEDTINRYNELKFEIDIYIPSIKTGIEYDGFLWHQDRQRDEQKNAKCKKNKIKLIRIREDGCAEIEEDTYCKIFHIQKGYRNLGIVIQALIKYLGNDDIDINIERDNLIITDNYINLYNKRWESMYLLALEHFQNNGNLVGIENKDLNSWIKRQRTRYNSIKNPLIKEQVNKLEEIGMSWDVFNDKWSDSYNLALDYYNKNGNIDVPISYKINNFALGSWVGMQRGGYKNNTLSSERIEKLNAIEMIWDASVDYDELWDIMYQLAKEYFQENGNLQINLRDKYKEKGLGQWINRQRVDYNKNLLPMYKINKLNEINMTWSVFDNKWEEFYNLLEAYFNENNNILVHKDYTIDGKRLGEWLNRQCLNKDKLSKEQILRLDVLGIVWKRKENKWDNMYSLACEYYQENGNLLINTHSSYKGQPLGSWINVQRTHYNNIGKTKENKEFTEDRIEKLEEIGMIWNIAEAQWAINYQTVEEYYKQFGNIDIPSNMEFKTLKIGKWLMNQKSSYRGYKGRRQLTNEEISKLEKLGIKW